MGSAGVIISLLIIFDAKLVALAHMLIICMSTTVSIDAARKLLLPCSGSLAIEARTSLNLVLCYFDQGVAELGFHGLKGKYSLTYPSQSSPDGLVHEHEESLYQEDSPPFQYKQCHLSTEPTERSTNYLFPTYLP